MKQTFIVYCRTSPACHRYIGYTKLTLMERWAQTLRDTKNGHTPLANAIRKYGTDTWQHEVLFETDDEQLAKDAECVYISLLGYYNIAKGGTGGNTGRNSDPDKRARQSKSLAKHWAKLPQAEKDRRTAKNVATRIKNGTLGNNNPRTGVNHGMHNGMWVCAGTEYATILEAAKGTGANPRTITDICIHRVDKVTVGKSKYIPKGKTPRECGWYKTKDIK